jgi:hypothetical protein
MWLSMRLEAFEWLVEAWLVGYGCEFWDWKVSVRCLEVVSGVL